MGVTANLIAARLFYRLSLRCFWKIPSCELLIFYLTDDESENS